MAAGPHHIDPNIWKACAGASVKVPVVHSLVYYFPQGHAEQASSPPLLSSPAISKPFILCRILSVDFLADSDTDEVFAKIRLQPLPQSPGGGFAPLLAVTNTTPVQDEESNEEGTGVASFVKVLTPSDANNGGGFSVPRLCADSIFPPLNFQEEPPLQTLSLTDVQGVVWGFRHIYRGTPLRHLLTTGWSKFVNHKKLIAGDSVVFMNDRRAGKLFVGVRRATRPSETLDCWRWRYGAGGASAKEEESGGEGFWRSGEGRVSAAAVAEAVESAAQGMAFEVEYYPRIGVADFVVGAEVVDSSLVAYWAAGMKVKMMMETADSSRMTLFQGTVSSAHAPDDGPWQGSPWRMLQVTWDEAVLRNVKSVSPWQVEPVSPMCALDTAFPSSKRFKAPPFPTTGVTISATSQFSSPLLNSTLFPVGMQGARHDTSCVSSSLPNLLTENAPPTCPENFTGSIFPPANMTEPNVESSASGCLSLDSQGSVHFSSSKHIGNHDPIPSPKDGDISFRLFGKIIHIKRSDGGRKKDDMIDDGLELSLSHRSNATILESCS